MITLAEIETVREIMARCATKSANLTDSDRENWALKVSVTLMAEAALELHHYALVLGAELEGHGDERH